MNRHFVFFLCKKRNIIPVNLATCFIAIRKISVTPRNHWMPVKKVKQKIRYSIIPLHLKLHVYPHTSKRSIEQNEFIMRKSVAEPISDANIRSLRTIWRFFSSIFVLTPFLRIFSILNFIPCIDDSLFCYSREKISHELNFSRAFGWALSRFFFVQKRDALIFFCLKWNS